jgi:hypothetical protein
MDSLLWVPVTTRVQTPCFVRVEWTDRLEGGVYLGTIL